MSYIVKEEYTCLRCGKKFDSYEEFKEHRDKGECKEA